MPWQSPRPISATELHTPRSRVLRIARRFGFVGRVEYRHVSTNTGGAQYGMGPAAEEDLLVVFPRAFERDANPEDYSLEAIIAHERGHQLSLRHARLKRMIRMPLTLGSEEFLASLLGSLLVDDDTDRDHLLLKAASEAMKTGLSRLDSLRLTAQVRGFLERIL